MAVLNYRLANVTVNSCGEIIQADQAAANTTTIWTVAKTASGNSANMKWAATQATFSSQTTTPKPTGAVSGAGADLLVTNSPLNGTFASGNWVFTFAVRATTASSQAGRVRVRVYKSTDPTGATGMTELTAATQVGTTSAALSTTADVTSVVTWTPGSTLVFNQEYLFFAVAWEITTASGSNNGNVVLRTGTSTTGSFLTTPNFTPKPSLVKEHPNRSRAHRYVAAGYDRW